MNKQLHTRRFTWQSLVLWIGLTTLGYIFAGFLHMPGGGPPIPFSLRNLDLFAGLVGFIFGGITGLVVALLQWVVLKSWTFNARYWIPLNLVGFGLVHGLSDAGLFIPLSTSLELVVGGLLVGLLQAIALRRAITRVILWVPVAAVAWLLGFQFAYALEKVFINNPLGSLFVGYGATGLVTGIITSFAMKLLMTELASQTGNQPNSEKTAMDQL